MAQAEAQPGVQSVAQAEAQPGAQSVAQAEAQPGVQAVAQAGVENTLLELIIDNFPRSCDVNVRQ